jgi:exopolysaccharide production protein ExoY
MTTSVRQRAVSRKSRSIRINKNRISPSPLAFNRSLGDPQPRPHPYSAFTNREATEADRWDASWKRALDLTCIVISLPVALPLMMLIVLWVRLVSPGPALYRQERIGQNGRRFVLYKVRSMKLNAGTGRHERHLRHLVKSDSPMTKLDLLCDSRLIPGGCLLRAAGLDELPQLLNVLRGEMSLVGPRPCLPEEYKFFSEVQRERFRALPGLTGTWQVNGKNQTTFSEMNVMDVRYVRRASLGMDLSIMLRTPAALLAQMCQAFRQHRISSKAHRVEMTVAGTRVGHPFPTQRID